MNTAETTNVLAPTVQPASDVTVGAQEYLSFCLGGEEYGIDILKVQEIRGYEQPTRMVGAAPFVKGVLNLRGVIVPILDLRLKFGMPNPTYDAMTVTVILALDRFVVGIVVDAVRDVIELNSQQIKAVPEFSANVDSNCVTGIASLQNADCDRMLILLDIEELMGASDMGLDSSSLQ